MDVQHVGEAALQVGQQRRLARDGTQQEVLHLGGDDRVEDRIAAMGDGVHLDHLAVLSRAVVLGKLAEGAFQLLHARQDASFDHHLGVGRHAHIIGEALDHAQRGAVQGAGDLQLVAIERGNGLRGQQRERVDADHHRHVQRLLARFGFLVEGPEVARQHQDRHALLGVDLDPVDRNVLRPRLRVSGDHQAGGDVGAVVVLAVGGYGQHLARIDALLHHLLAECLARRHLPPGQRVLGGLAEALQQLRLGHAHGFGNPAAARHEARHHWHVMPAGPGEIDRLPAVEPLGDGGQLVFEFHTFADDGQAAGVGQVGEPATQVGGKGGGGSGHERAGRSGKWDQAERSSPAGRGVYSPATSLRRSTLPTGDLGISATNTYSRGRLKLGRSELRQ